MQTDLLANKLIPEPFYGNNEAELQWIGLADWEYQTKFQADAATVGQEHVELVFDGLDTYAEIFVNDAKVLETGNMFRTWRVDVKKNVKSGENTLRVVFHSPVMTWLPKLRMHLITCCRSIRHRLVLKKGSRLTRTRGRRLITMVGIGVHGS